MTAWTAPTPAPGPRAAHWLHRPGRGLRVAAAAMTAVAAAWPILPFHPPFACPLRAVTGIPCPLCGMTRSVVAAVHGHIVTSLAFNPGGIVVVMLALVALVRPSSLTRLRVPIWAVFTVFGALWLWNIGWNPTFHQIFLR